MSVQFDGTTARLATAGVPTTGAITCMGWFYNATTPSTSQTWISLQSALFATGWAWIGVTAAGYVYIGVQDDAGNIREVTEFTLKADPQSWVHVAVVVNGSAPIQVILSVLQRGIDAQQIVALGGSGTLGVITPVALYLGGDDLNGDATPDELFSGAATQVRIWQAALTRTEIRAERDSALAVRAANLYLDTPLSVFTDLTDVSGNGNDWTAIGTVSTGAMASPVQPWPTRFSRFYVNNGLDAYGTQQTQIGPWNSTSVSGANCAPFKYADSTGGVVSRSGSETSSSPTFQRLITRLATTRLAAQTISGTLDVCLGITESAADADFYWAATAWVAGSIPGGGLLNRGTLFYGYTEDAGTGTEWPTTNTARGFNAPIPMTPVACEEGDVIMIEVGYIARNTLTASRTGTLRTGGATATLPTGATLPDLTPGSTNTLAEAGWVEFSVPVTPVAMTVPNFSAATPTLVAVGNPTVAAPYLDSQPRAQMAGWGMGGPHPSCASNATTGHYAESWYLWTPSVTGTARFDLLVGSQSVLRAYTGEADNLTQIACVQTITQRTLLFAVTAGTPYYVVAGRRFMPGAGGTGGAQDGQDFQLYVPVAPTNDTCATATVIASLPFSGQSDATLAPAAPAQPPASTNPFVDSQTYALWWSFTAPRDMRVSVSLEFSAQETQLTVWTGVCGALTEVSNSPWWNTIDTDGSGIETFFYAKLVLRATAGTTYYIVVAGDFDPIAGLTQLDAAEVFLTGDNDTAATATLISSYPLFLAQSNFASADLQSPDGDPSCGDPGPDWEGKFLWYKWTAPESVEMQFNTAPSQQAGTGLAIYTGSPGALVQVDCKDFNFAGNFLAGNARIIFTPTAGTTYYIRVWSDGRTWLTLNLFIDRTDRGVLGGDIIIGCGAIFIYTPEGAIRDYLFLNGYTFSGIPTNGSFDPANETQLYVSQWGADQIVQVDTTVVPMTLVKYTPTTPGDRPEGNAFRRGGELVTGFRAVSDPADDLRQYAMPAGTLTETWNPVVEDEGTGWIDMDGDRRTVVYTSAARRVLQFDLQTGQQLPDFALLPDSGLGPLFAQGVRILPDGGVAVADYSQVTRTNAAGVTTQVYAIPINTDVHVLDVAPDGLSIWVGVTIGNHVYRVQLSDGSILAHWVVPAVGNYLCGLAVRDGLRAIETICPVIGAFTVVPVTPTCPGVPGEL